VTDHQRMRENAGAYLLGALADPEHEAFERHLADCPECRATVERLRPAAEALPRAVEPLAPPPGLKSSLLEAVREEAGAATRPAPARRRSRWRRSLRLTPASALASAAFLVALGVAAGFGVATLSGDDEPRTLAATVESREIPHASGSLSIPADGKEGGILRVSGLPSPPRGVYQAWVQRGGEVLPQPTFEVGGNGVGAVALPEDLSDATAVMVTREPRGGSRAPSEAPVLSVRL